MTDNRTSNTGDITTQETYPSLLQSIVALLGFPQILIDLVDGALKGRKLHHCIGDLSPPQWIQPFIQPSDALLRSHLPPAISQRIGKRWQCRLHADLDGLQGAKRDVGEEFCGCRSRKVDDGFVGRGEHLVAIDVLEDFVETVLARTLEGVADQGWRPAEEDAPEAFFGVDCTPGLDIGAIEFGVDLATAFHLQPRALAKADGS